jgi:dienelactone hydrolase
MVVQLWLISDTLSASTILWGDLTPGKYQVGFKVVNALDTSRQTSAAPAGRPIQVSVWYPAVPPSEARRLLYRDYFCLTASELGAENVTEVEKRNALERYRQLLTSNGIPGASVDQWMTTEMEAFLDVPHRREAFPLILVAQGNMQSAHHQAILCEYLASHGNVVATCPSQTRISGPLENEDAVASSALEQSEDINFVGKEVSMLFNIDSARIALVAHSFGARSALLFAARHAQHVRAMVSLDGGIGSKTANDFTRQVPGFDRDSVIAPLLHIYEESDLNMKPDFALIMSLRRADRFLVRIDSIRHLDFSSFGMVAGTIPGFKDSLATPNRGDASLKKRCEAIYKLTEGFLSSFLGEASPSRQSNPELRLVEGIMRLTRFRPEKE